MSIEKKQAKFCEIIKLLSGKNTTVKISSDFNEVDIFSPSESVPDFSMVYDRSVDLYIVTMCLIVNDAKVPCGDVPVMELRTKNDAITFITMYKALHKLRYI